MKFRLGSWAPCLPLLASLCCNKQNKKVICKFSARFLEFSNKVSTVQKIVLSSSREQANFRGLEDSRPRPRTSKCVLEDVLEAKDVLENSTSGLTHWKLYTVSNLMFIFLRKIMWDFRQLLFTHILTFIQVKDQKN